MDPILIGIIVFALFIVFSMVKTVKEQQVVIVERFGGFSRLLRPGLHFLIPFIDRISGRVSLKIKQLDVKIETKTRDNVFVVLQVSVHVQVISGRVKEAFYSLDNPYGQISSYIFDDVRAEVPKMDLDDVFARKEDIATAVKVNLSESMEDYGYLIVKALITDIDPDIVVKESMNRINAALRNKEASTEEAEARKIVIIKEAEADKESKRLQGEGVAEQRLAIIKGFADSVEDFSNTLQGVSPNEIMQFVLMTQHYDTIKEVGMNNSTVLVPSSPGSMKDLQQQIMEGTLIGEELGDLSKQNREKVRIKGTNEK